MNNPSDISKAQRNLRALVDFSRLINSSKDINFILNNFLLTCMGKFLATKGFVALKRNHKLKTEVVKGFAEDFFEQFQSFHYDNPEPHYVISEFDEHELIGITVEIQTTRGFIGVLCLGNKLDKSSYTEDDKEFLTTISNIASTAIENTLIVEKLKEVNKSLDSKVNRLSSLFELGKEFGLLSEKQRVAKLLVYSIIGQFLVSNYSVILYEKKKIEILESKIQEEKLRNAFNEIEIEEINFAVNRELIKKRYQILESCKIELIIPMQIHGVTKGLILLGKRFNNLPYTEADIEFIYSIGSLAIVSLENARLFIEALEKQRMEEELELAKEIQTNLLPSSIPKIKNFELAALNFPSRQIGGDYYDFIMQADNKLCFAIADVSGKGVPAALLMANLQAFLRSICKRELEISEATGLINDLVSENTTPGKFITFFWGLINPDSKSISFVNAGHNPPLFIRNKKLTKLEEGGMILGVMKTLMPYKSKRIQLEKGDTVILFSDGITEAMNESGEEFSDERLEQLAVDLSDKNADEILRIIKEEVKSFTKDTEQSDDITLMVIKAL